MISFSILVLTYNRHELLKKTLESIIGQTYGNFEVILIDNGSQPPVADIVNKYNDKRIKLKRYESNAEPCDVPEDFLDELRGTHYLTFTDDDVLLPSALEIVAEVMGQNGNIESLQVGFTHFYHDTGTCNLKEANLNAFDGRLEVFEAAEAARFFFNGWGIGPAKRYNGPKMAHSSGAFISRSLIERTRKKQGKLYVKPFGDIGLVGTLLHTKKAYFLNLPLVIIGRTRISEMNGSKPGQRQKWNYAVKYLEHSPIKGVSFINMGADAHLQVLFRNKYNGKYDCRLRPDFYYWHLKAVASDKRWTWITLRDIAECIPHYLISMYRFLTLREAMREIVRLSSSLKKVASRTLRAKIKPGGQTNGVRHDDESLNLSFKDINSFAEWVNTNYIESLRNIPEVYNASARILK